MWYTMINSKLITEKKVSLGTKKVLEETIGRHFLA